MLDHRNVHEYLDPNELPRLWPEMCVPWQADVQPGHSVEAAARRKRRDTYPELDGRLVVVGVEVGGRFGREVAQLLSLLARQ